MELRFVIGPDGKGAPGTVEVVSAMVPELVEPAKQVAKKPEFTPGGGGRKAREDAGGVAERVPPLAGETGRGQGPTSKRTGMTCLACERAYGEGCC